MRIKTASVIVLALVGSLGADGNNGCSTEYQPGDGSSQEWSMAEIPTAAGADLPMTCEWLESSNCWQQVVQSTRACAPTAMGEFSEDRSACTFDDGSVLQLAGPISDPAERTTHFPIVEHRMLDADGDPCFTGRILGVGHTALGTPEETVVLQSLNVTQYRVICPDGSSYSNAVEGTCSDFGLRWLVKKTPGYTMTCDGSTDECTGEFWGASAAGADTLFTCR